MFSSAFPRPKGWLAGLSGRSSWLIMLVFLGCWLTPLARAQNTSQQPPANPNKQEAPPEAGGPQNDVGPYVVPKKKEEPPPPAPEKPKKIEGMPDYSIKVDVPLVNLDVLVTTKDGQAIPGLKKENFKILEDGAEQKITTFNQSEALRSCKSCGHVSRAFPSAYWGWDHYRRRTAIAVAARNIMDAASQVGTRTE